MWRVKDMQVDIWKGEIKKRIDIDICLFPDCLSAAAPEGT